MFWKNVDRSEGQNACWIWKKGKDARGYGILRFRGRAYKAHRLAWILTHGEIDDDLFVCHHCDNPPCVNPGHMFIGTQSDNMRDMVSKGRHNPPRGSTNPLSKLTEKQVFTIRWLYSENDLSQDRIAQMYQVSQVLISKVVRREIWRHVK